MKSDLEVDCNAKNKTLHLDTLCLRLQLQSQRGGAAGDLSGGVTSRSSYNGGATSRSQYGGGSEYGGGESRPSTAASGRSAHSNASSVRTASTQHTARHSQIMRQLEKQGVTTPRPPTGLTGLSRPSTAKSTARSTASGKKMEW